MKPADAAGAMTCPSFPPYKPCCKLDRSHIARSSPLVPDGFDVETLVAATEKITRTLDEPHTGILFTVPVTRAWGLHRRQS